MAVRPNQYRAIRVNAISVVPVAVGIAEVTVLANRKGDEWRPRRAYPLRGPSPRVAVAAGQQHKMRTEQVDGRDLLVATSEPDMGRAAAGPGGGHIFGDGIVDRDRRRAVRHDRRRLIAGPEYQPLFVQEFRSRQDVALPRGASHRQGV